MAEDKDKKEETLLDLLIYIQNLDNYVADLQEFMEENKLTPEQFKKWQLQKDTRTYH